MRLKLVTVHDGRRDKDETHDREEEQDEKDQANDVVLAFLVQVLAAEFWRRQAKSVFRLVSSAVALYGRHTL